jgi:hypothetical protein
MTPPHAASSSGRADATDPHDDREGIQLGGQDADVLARQEKLLSQYADIVRAGAEEAAQLLRLWPSYVLMGVGLLIVVLAFGCQVFDERLAASEYRATLTAGVVVCLGGGALNAFTQRTLPELVRATTRPPPAFEAELQAAAHRPQKDGIEDALDSD